MRKIKWTPFLILMPIFVILVIIRNFQFWTAFSILIFIASFVKAMVYFSLDRLLIRFVKVKYVWLIELLFIAFVLTITLSLGMPILESVIFL